MNAKERHRLCAEILQGTNGGKDLSEPDLMMVHHELLNDKEDDDDRMLQDFHEEVTTGQYPNHDLFGLKGLRCDVEYNITYESILVASTNARWLRTDEAKAWAKELHSWCVAQDQKGAEISFAAATLRDIPPERLQVPTKPGRVNAPGKGKKEIERER